jgi:hypothetical protein
MSLKHKQFYFHSAIPLFQTLFQFVALCALGLGRTIFRPSFRHINYPTPSIYLQSPTKPQAYFVTSLLFALETSGFHRKPDPFSLTPPLSGIPHVTQSTSNSRPSKMRAYEWRHEGMQGDQRCSSTHSSPRHLMEVNNFTPRPLHPRGKQHRHPFNKRLGGPQSWYGRLGQEKESPAPAGIRTPKRRVRSAASRPLPRLQIIL